MKETYGEDTVRPALPNPSTKTQYLVNPDKPFLSTVVHVQIPHTESELQWTAMSPLSYACNITSHE